MRVSSPICSTSSAVKGSSPAKPARTMYSRRSPRAFSTFTKRFSMRTPVCTRVWLFMSSPSAPREARACPVRRVRSRKGAALGRPLSRFHKRGGHLPRPRGVLAAGILPADLKVQLAQEVAGAGEDGEREAHGFDHDFEGVRGGREGLGVLRGRDERGREAGGSGHLLLRPAAGNPQQGQGAGKFGSGDTEAQRAHCRSCASNSRASCSSVAAAVFSKAA